MARVTVNVSRNIRLDFTIVDEWCCGSLLLRTGRWEIAADQARHNIRVIEEAEVDGLITTCARCYRNWNKDYREGYKDLLGVDYDFEVLHTMELLAPLIRRED